MPVRNPLFTVSGQDTGRAVALPPPPSELTRALEADGIAYFGMVAIYDQPQTGRPPLDLDGRLCVVAYVDDVLIHEVRIVRRGSKPNRFHLIDTAGRAAVRSRSFVDRPRARPGSGLDLIQAVSGCICASQVKRKNRYNFPSHLRR